MAALSKGQCERSEDVDGSWTRQRGAWRAISVRTVLRAGERDLTTIVSEDTGGFSFLGRNPSLNDVGQVSFAAGFSGGEGEAILRRLGRALTQSRNRARPFNFFGFDAPLNDVGQVAFKAELDDFDEGLFVGSGELPLNRAVVDSRSPPPPDPSRSRPLYS